MPVSLVEVASKLSKAEGLKHQASVGDVRELLRLLFTSYKLHEIVLMWMRYNKVKS